MSSMPASPGREVGNVDDLGVREGGPEHADETVHFVVGQTPPCQRASRLLQHRPAPPDLDESGFSQPEQEVADRRGMQHIGVEEQPRPAHGQVS